jgi:hypothetical protein
MKLVLAFAFLAIIAITSVLALGKQQDFNISTVAICEQGIGSTYCHDEILVACGDESYFLQKGDNEVSCGSMVLSVPQITSAAVFEGEWADPRAK